MSSSLLSTHLTQIASCSSSIASLSFPQPKIFTNALLHTSDITALIRDTEAHERALFHLAPPSLPSKAADFTGSVTVAVPTARRATGYGAGVRQPKSKAVAAVLGGDLYRKTRRAEDAGVNRQGIDVEVLLEGAEKLVPSPEQRTRLQDYGNDINSLRLISPTTRIGSQETHKSFN
ncbi:hypothetical protein LTR10_007310 [Elasticomyces elasticus]|nr:hypothetical protein LTR10_007310 [Elasticomyces elasticus]